jgi:hypothetical protein
VDFSDYNREVLEELTMPNVLLNVPEKTISDESTPPETDESSPETRFFAGDWRALDAAILAPLCREIRWRKFQCRFTCRAKDTPCSGSVIRCFLTPGSEI